MRRSKIGGVLAILMILYLGSYAFFRTANAEIWERDGQTYVIFPQDQPVFYYAYRPLTYIDAALTGMRFHIGPHR